MMTSFILHVLWPPLMRPGRWSPGSCGCLMLLLRGPSGKHNTRALTRVKVCMTNHSFSQFNDVRGSRQRPTRPQHHNTTTFFLSPLTAPVGETHFIMDISRLSRLSTRHNFDLPALLRRAAELRQTPCSCDESQQYLGGGLNCVVFLTFEDGVEWIFRFPNGDSGVSKECASLLLSSEVATLKYVKENSSIPVPTIFDYR